MVLPKPVSRCQYWHRSLNIKKLVEVRFSAIPQRETLAGMIKKLKIPDRPMYPLRKMDAADAPAVHKLLEEDLSRRKLRQVLPVARVLPRAGPLWPLSGPSQAPLWSLSGPSLVPLWFHSGPTLVPLWSHSGPTLAPLWPLSGPSLASIRLLFCT